MHFKTISSVILTKTEDPDISVLITTSFVVIKSTFFIDEKAHTIKMQ